jgi:porin
VKAALCSLRCYLLIVSAGSSLVLGISETVLAQKNQPPSVRCRKAANPQRLHSECVGRTFDFNEETWTKDWMGLRADLDEHGIKLTASYTTQPMGNISGGQSLGFTYAATLEGSLFLDLGKLIGVSGLSFHGLSAWSSGRNLSADSIGNIFTVQSTFSSPNNGTSNLTVGEMYLQQKVSDDSIILAAGRLTPQSTFATMPVLNQYVNGAINPIPGHIAINDFSFTSYPPGAEWGAQGIYNINKKFQIAAGLFNTNQNSAGGAKGGADFVLQQGNRGALSVAQVNYFVNHGSGDTGLPGQYAVGAFYDGNTFPSLTNINTRQKGTYSIYSQFQQMVHRVGDADSHKGMTVWAETAIAPKVSVNKIPYLVAGGLNYEGLIQRRGSDIFSAGVISGIFSRNIPRTSAETVIEMNYQITFKRWFSITPDVQYVIRPAGSSAIGNAFVLGAQTTIVF